MAGDIKIGDVAGGIAKIVGLFKVDPALAVEMQNKAEERETKIQLQQILLNMTEATQGLFKGGWRPFIGWVCGAAFAYNFVLQPFLIFGFTMAGFATEVAALPELDIVAIMPVLLGMLGLSHHRSGDKRNGVHKS